MTWDQIQQVLRIVLYTLGGFLFGSDIADGATFQAALGGLMSVGAFVWWYFTKFSAPVVVEAKATPLGSQPRL